MTYIYKSGLKSYILGLITQKRADGFAYISEEQLFRQLDNFCMEYFPDARTITYDFAARWSSARPFEGNGYHNRRISALRQLNLYILSLGKDAYVPDCFFWKEYKPALYIPSKDEVAALFQEMDAQEYWSHSIVRRLEKECRIMFLLYFCCGLRLSEARFLRRCDVDLERGILTVLSSKGDKSRLVYLPADGTVTLMEYMKEQKSVYPLCEWMFPGWNPEKPISSSGVEQCFKRYWSKLPISKSLDRHPTPHCLRHAFVVERLNNWMLQGIDTNEMLPYLSRYLGHKGPEETYYYYHLADKAFDVIRKKDSLSRRIIPEVVPYED